MRPVYLQIDDDHGFDPHEHDKIVKFAGQPVDLVALIDTDVPFRFLEYQRSQHYDFVSINRATECFCT